MAKPGLEAFARMAKPGLRASAKAAAGDTRVVASTLVDAPPIRAQGLRRGADRWVLVALALHAVVVVAALASGSWLGVPVVAIAMLWASNTVSHIHLHTPLFGARAANQAVSGYLTVALSVPQSLWRQRHLRHHARHADRVPPLVRRVVAAEVLAIGLTGAALAAVGVVLPWAVGTAVGYTLCALQGRMEHVAGVQAGWSTYGRWHNRLWFNDGHHAEHHRFPGVHWSELPALRLAAARTSSKTPLGRLLEVRPVLLGWLELALLRVPWLRERVLRAHTRAIANVLAGVEVRHALVVGGGLYPRTALVLRALRPAARVTILDAEESHLDVARRFLAAREGAPEVELSVGFWTADSAAATGIDLITLPLALRGVRTVGTGEGACARLVHAWIWERRRGRRSAVVAWWLLKRVVLVPAGRP